MTNDQFTSYKTRGSTLVHHAGGSLNDALASLAAYAIANGFDFGANCVAAMQRASVKDASEVTPGSTPWRAPTFGVHNLSS